MKTLKELVAKKLATGNNFFTKSEAIKVLDITDEQFKYQAYRLSKKKVINRLVSDFYMIISPEYYYLGSLPPLWIIDSLMKYLEQEYYVGLLSAASLYGATHQQPMAFQVITNKTTRDISLERGAIEFHTYAECHDAFKKSFTVPTGYVSVSTCEQTMLDLIRFYQAAGYMSNVALVIKSLAEQCDTKELETVIKQEKSSPVLQRLGYILATLKFSKLAALIAKELEQRTIRYILFIPDSANKVGEKIQPWKLILNDTLDLNDT